MAVFHLTVRSYISPWNAATRWRCFDGYHDKHARAALVATRKHSVASMEHMVKNHGKLVGGLEHEWIIFPYFVGMMIQSDFHSIIFQRGRSTTKQ